MNEMELIAAGAAFVILLMLQGVLLVRVGNWRTTARQLQHEQQTLSSRLEQVVRDEARQGREDARNDARQGREELTTGLNGFGQAIGNQVMNVTQLQATQFETFGNQLTALTRANEQKLDAIRVVVEEKLAAVAAESLRALTEVRQTVDEKLAAAQADARAGRTEMGDRLHQFGGRMAEQMGQIAELLKNQLTAVSEAFNQQLSALTTGNETKLEHMRTTLEQRLAHIQTENTQKLEQMRQTVDEKLHNTLEQRLGESFRLVSERLDQVHRGLGEMQTLATGVGDLKKVLTNVKSRGTWGEVQLENLLEQILTSEQYAKNVATRPGSGERVEFAIRLPGRDEAQSVVWLPIDAKFPQEDYLALTEAQEQGNVAGVETAGKALEARIRTEARTIRDKYVCPPHTTDFAVLYLPTEGLYADVLRRTGLVEQLQREWRVTLAGPTTLSAFLNSLQMGFRTLAIEKRSSEVWQVLGAVKTEFGKFGDVLAATKKKLEQATESIGKAETRTRQITRKLKTVEALPGPEAEGMLGALEDLSATEDLEEPA